MDSFKHSTTVTDPSGRFLFGIGGGGQCAEGLSDEQLLEQIKDNILRELKWDIQLFRTR